MNNKAWKWATLTGVLALIITTTASAAALLRSSSAGTTASVTLTVWDTGTGAQAQLNEKLAARFEKRHPGVTVNRVQYSYNDLNAKLRLALSGPNPPDVLQLAGVPANGPLMVKAGLLLNLDPYARQYGWRKKFAKALLAWASFTPDGSRRGIGSLYGISSTGEALGIYYDRARLKALGVSLPRTLGQFDTVLAKAKAAGMTPILLGNLEKWPGYLAWTQVLNVAAGTRYSAVNAFGYSRPGTSIRTSATRASTIFQGWASKGYINPDSAGLSYNDLIPQLAKRRALFILDGSWLGADLQGAGLAKKIGFALLPPLKGGGPAVATGTGGQPYGIPANAKNKDLAAAYLGFITSRQASLDLARIGGLPSISSLGYTPPAGSTQADLFRSWALLLRKNGLLSYVDTATPTMGDTLGAGVQELIAGRIKPKALANRIQQDFDKANPSKR
jgi:raffinose/stachyose/melibiose transport system substrate-binding protein